MINEEHIIRCYQHLKYEVKCETLSINKDFIAFTYKSRPYTLDFNKLEIKYRGALIIGDEVAELLTYIFMKIYLLPNSELHEVE